ncbi:MAG: glutaminyl-peptide cyclotransferase [Firmicutes bacterium]|jgi:glutamine cyclotransferase|nr:glutaminyl-peptide cyclotransferase [Bacillota bacterium]
MRTSRFFVVWFALFLLVNGHTWAASSLAAHYTYDVVQVYPHDPEAFTQGLVWHQGRLYEGTGLYGKSTLREVDLETGEVLRAVSLAEEYFGEGTTIIGNRIYQLTWRENKGFVYDLESFSLVGEFQYATEGWGLTNDGQHLIMSDGSDRLYFLDPSSFEVVRQVRVLADGQSVRGLNELEYIDGEVYANVWLTDFIVRINPTSGRVEGWIDLRGLLDPELAAEYRVDVLNGIAYDAETGRLFVTGKLWPQLYQVRLRAVSH